MSQNRISRELKRHKSIAIFMF